jgi:hypothetical protein
MHTRFFHKALIKKGFVEEKKRDHIFYIFTDKDGKLFRRIHTKIRKLVMEVVEIFQRTFSP